MTKYNDRLRQGANIRFGLAAAILILAGIFLIWPNYQQLKDSQIGIADQNEQISSTEVELESERNKYRLLKNEYALDATIDESTITAILPESAEETNIVRELEKEALALGGENNSLILESVNIGTASNQKDVDYLVLPIKISITGTKEKLLSFLRYLEKTGTVVENEASNRLLDVQDVTMQIKDRGTQTEIAGEVSVDISTNAYILPTPEEIAAQKAAKK